tara:strand:- start:127 stop:360 length:234 start_codon:yes stop_codon:yes gene_type:complete
MTSKDFQLIAEVVKTIPLPQTRRATALNFAMKLHDETDGPFNTITFLKACGVNETVDSKAQSERDQESARKESFIAP